MAQAKQQKHLHRLERGWNNQLVIGGQVTINSNSPTHKRNVASLLPPLKSFEEAGDPSYLERRRKAMMNRPNPPSTFTSISSTFGLRHHEGTDQSAELKVIKYILIREGLVMKLVHLCEKMNKGILLGEKKVVDSEILDTLAQIRDVTVNYIEMLCYWRESAIDFEPHNPRVFTWENINYTMKIIGDLDFLAEIIPLVEALQLAPAKMRANPLMLPNTLDEGDTWIDPMERATFDAGGENEGALYEERYRIRIAERVLLQEIECNLLRQPLPAWESEGANQRGDALNVSAGVQGNSQSGESFGDYPRNIDSLEPVMTEAEADRQREEEQDARNQALITWHLEAMLQLNKLGGNIGEQLHSSSTNRMEKIPLKSDRVPGTPKFMHKSPWKAEPTKLTEHHSVHSAAELVPYIRAVSPLPRPGTGTSKHLSTARSSGSLGSKASPPRNRSNGASPSRDPSEGSPKYNNNIVSGNNDSRSVKEFHTQNFDCLQLDDMGNDGNDPTHRVDSFDEASVGSYKSLESRKSQTSRATTASSVLSTVVEVMSAEEIVRIVDLEVIPRKLQLALAACVILLTQSSSQDDIPRDVSFDAFKKLAAKYDLATAMNATNPKKIAKYKIRALKPFLPQLEDGGESDFADTGLSIQEIAICNRICRWVTEVVRSGWKYLKKVAKRASTPIQIAAAAVHVSRTNRPVGMMKTNQFAREVTMLGVTTRASVGKVPSTAPQSPGDDGASVNSRLQRSTSLHSSLPAPVVHPPVPSGAVPISKPSAAAAKAPISKKQPSKSVANNSAKEKGPKGKHENRVRDISELPVVIDRRRSGTAGRKHSIDPIPELWPVHTEILQNAHEHPLLLTLLSSRPDRAPVPHHLDGPELHMVVKIYDLVTSQEAVATINVREFSLLHIDLKERYASAGDVDKFFEPHSIPWWTHHIQRVIIIRVKGDGSLLLVVSKKLVEQVVLEEMSRPHAAMRADMKQEPFVSQESSIYNHSGPTVSVPQPNAPAPAVMSSEGQRRPGSTSKKQLAPVVAPGKKPHPTTASTAAAASAAAAHQAPTPLRNERRNSAPKSAAGNGSGNGGNNGDAKAVKESKGNGHHKDAKSTPAGGGGRNSAPLDKKPSSAVGGTSAPPKPVAVLKNGIVPAAKQEKKGAVIGAAAAVGGSKKPSSGDDEEVVVPNKETGTAESASEVTEVLVAEEKRPEDVHNTAAMNADEVPGTEERDVKQQAGETNQKEVAGTQAAPAVIDAHEDEEQYYDDAFEGNESQSQVHSHDEAVAKESIPSQQSVTPTAVTQVSETVTSHAEDVSLVDGSKENKEDKKDKERDMEEGSHYEDDFIEPRSVTHAFEDSVDSIEAIKSLNNTAALPEDAPGAVAGTMADIEAVPVTAEPVTSSPKEAAKGVKVIEVPVLVEGEGEYETNDNGYDDDFEATPVAKAPAAMRKADLKTTAAGDDNYEDDFEATPHATPAHGRRSSGSTSQSQSQEGGAKKSPGTFFPRESPNGSRRNSKENKSNSNSRGQGEIVVSTGSVDHHKEEEGQRGDSAENTSLGNKRTQSAETEDRYNEESFDAEEE